MKKYGVLAILSLSLFGFILLCNSTVCSKEAVNSTVDFREIPICAQSAVTEQHDLVYRGETTKICDLVYRGEPINILLLAEKDGCELVK